jgi:excisionase family DNA binding protein
MARKADNEEDLSRWIPKSDVVRETGISERSLERRVQARKIRQGYRTMPGRRPLPVLHPDDVAALRGEMVQRATEEQERSTSVATVPIRPSGTEAFNSLLSALSHNTPHERPAFLGLKEASTYVGLSIAYSRRLIEAGELDAVKDRGWRIRRRDLDAL